MLAPWRASWHPKARTERRRAPSGGSGALQRRRDARLRREVERARRQWPELVHAAATAVRDGERIPRLLQQRGYREFFVRRWLTRRLAAELVERERAD